MKTALNILVFSIFAIQTQGLGASTPNPHLRHYLTVINNDTMSKVNDFSIIENAKIKTYNKEGKRICNLDGCGGKFHSTGLCQKHYQQVKKYGRLAPEKEHGNEAKTLNNEGKRICNAPGCVCRHESGGALL